MTDYLNKARYELQIKASMVPLAHQFIKDHSYLKPDDFELMEALVGEKITLYTDRAKADFIGIIVEILKIKEAESRWRIVEEVFGSFNNK